MAITTRKDVPKELLKLWQDLIDAKMNKKAACQHAVIEYKKEHPEFEDNFGDVGRACQWMPAVESINKSAKGKDDDDSLIADIPEKKKSTGKKGKEKKQNKDYSKRI